MSLDKYKNLRFELNRSGTQFKKTLGSVYFLNLKGFLPYLYICTEHNTGLLWIYHYRKNI